MPRTEKYVQRSDCRIDSLTDAEYKKVTRDVKERGRDIEGCIKQWMSFVKPNFQRYVEPQRKVAGMKLFMDPTHSD